MRAAQWGESDCIGLLINRRADVNAKDTKRRTALHKAALWGYADTVSLLLTNGAIINAKDGKGYTALHRAASAGKEEVTELLLNKGATNEKCHSSSSNKFTAFICMRC